MKLFIVYNPEDHTYLTRRKVNKDEQEGWTKDFSKCKVFNSKSAASNSARSNSKKGSIVIEGSFYTK